MADRICDNCMSRVPAYAEKCPRCGIHFENTNPGGALPNGWVLADRYTVGRYIDIDGEGVMYSAIDGDTMQRVIIKEFMPVTLCASRDEDGSIRPKPGCEVLFKTTRLDFSDLFASVMRLGHVEGLVQVLDVFDENNTGYAVVEKIEGPTLAEYLTKREGPVDSARALALLRPVMNGVEVLHGANLIHRGISPENIVLESGGTARLSGFATLALRQQGSELKAKLYPGYSAPEQYAASEFEGRYTDIYALGAVLYRMLTGRTPDAADERRAQDEVRPARTVNKEVPTFLSTGVARAMRLAPNERIQTIPDLRLALSGEGPKEKKGPLGLSRQQLTVAVVAAAAVVVLLLIILLISALTRNKDDASSSSSSSSSISSSSSLGEEIPDFTGKLAADIIKNDYYLSTYKFAEPIEENNEDVPQGRIIRQEPAAGTIWDGKTPIQLYISAGSAAVDLPDFVKKDQSEAIAWLEKNDIAYSTKTVDNSGSWVPGLVTAMDPAAGTSVKPGVDKVTLSVAGQVTTVAMVDLKGKTEAQARQQLDALGYKYQIDYYDNTAGVSANGTVQSTAPAPGEQVAPESTVIKVAVLKNYLMPNMSGYVGQTVETLTGYLSSMGVPYNPNSQGTIDTSDPNLGGKVAEINYGVGVGGEVSAGSNMLTFKTYNYVAPPTPPPAEPTPTPPPEGG